MTSDFLTLSCSRQAMRRGSGSERNERARGKGAKMERGVCTRNSRVGKKRVRVMYRVSQKND